MRLYKGYVNKLEILLLKIKEDGQVTPTELKLFQGLLKEYEFEQFQKLLKEYESGMMNSKSEIKSKDVKKLRKWQRQQRLNQLYEKTLQELKH